MKKSRNIFNPGMDDQMFRLAMLGQMQRDHRFEAHEGNYLQIVDRYVKFYDMELLSFLEEEDIEHFLIYELRVTSAGDLPFLEDYYREGQWILKQFAELAGNEFVLVQTRDPEPIKPNFAFPPLDDQQIDSLFDTLQDDPFLHLVVRFGLSTGMHAPAIERSYIDDLDLQRGTIKMHTAPWPTSYFSLGPILRVDLLNYLESRHSRGYPDVILFPYPDAINWTRKWFWGVIMYIQNQIDRLDSISSGWFYATHYDQLRKAGGSQVGHKSYYTELAFRDRKGLQEDELYQIYSSSVHPKLKGCFSLYDLPSKT